jgi:hypothetical protein
MPKSFKDWWPVITATAAGLWVAYTYFDNRQAVSQLGPAPTIAAPLPRPSPTPSVTAEGGIAIVGNVTDSDLKVDAQGK